MLGGFFPLSFESLPLLPLAAEVTKMEITYAIWGGYEFENQNVDHST